MSHHYPIRFIYHVRNPGRNCAERWGACLGNLTRVLGALLTLHVAIKHDWHYQGLTLPVVKSNPNQRPKPFKVKRNPSNWLTCGLGVPKEAREHTGELPKMLCLSCPSYLSPVCTLSIRSLTILCMWGFHDGRFVGLPCWAGAGRELGGSWAGDG